MVIWVAGKKTEFGRGFTIRYAPGSGKKWESTNIQQPVLSTVKALAGIKGYDVYKHIQGRKPGRRTKWHINHVKELLKAQPSEIKMRIKS